MRVLMWIMAAVLSVSVVHASESLYDIYGTVHKIEEWPIYLEGRLQGHITTITVNDQAYPLVAKPQVFRATNYPAMYPKAPAGLSEVQPGKNVNMRLNGHSVFEIILTR